jgi:hypothetical protein
MPKDVRPSRPESVERTSNVDMDAASLGWGQRCSVSKLKGLVANQRHRPRSNSSTCTFTYTIQFIYDLRVTV